MERQIATTSEQSSRLLRCGVSADTADMCWIAPDRLVTGGVGSPTLMYAEYFKHDDSMHQTPAWSLGALLGLLPFKIHSGKYEYWLDIAPMDYGRQWSIGYYEVGGRKYVSDPDWHTPSWCTTSEMEDCINRIFKNEDGELYGDYSEWLALLGAMKGYEADGGECRAVFWFDN